MGLLDLFFSSNNSNTTTSTSISTASKTESGIVKVGENINVSKGVISVPLATSYEGNDVPGVVTIGEGLILGQNGRISVPYANSEGGAGIVQCGQNIEIGTNGMISVPTAATNKAGVIKVGDGLTITRGVLSVQTATADGFGVVKAGENVQITNGVISIPLATSYEGNDIPGVVTVGDGIILGQNGRISVPRANDQGGAGIVQAGAGITISENGIISVQTATNKRAGAVKVGKGLTIDNDGTISVELNYDEINKLILNLVDSNINQKLGAAFDPDKRPDYYSTVTEFIDNEAVKVNYNESFTDNSIPVIDWSTHKISSSYAVVGGDNFTLTQNTNILTATTTTYNAEAHNNLATEKAVVNYVKAYVKAYVDSKFNELTQEINSLKEMLQNK